MSKNVQKSSRAAPVVAPIVFDLRDRVPQMTDDALATLNANALRLKDSGSVVQRTAAIELLPVIETELADRRAFKLANPPPKKPRASKKKPAAVIAEAAKPAPRDQPEPSDEPALLDEPEAEAQADEE